MKIIILGAGQVGATAARNLAREQANEVTVVDTNAELLRDLQDRLDIRTVEGYASHPSVLTRAGAEDADMLIALTNRDETNMVACQVAYTLFHTPTKIARIRSGDYANHAKLFDNKAMPVDVLISPEELVTAYIARLIQYPGAFQVLEFANDRVRLVGVRARKGGLLVGQELKALKEHIPNTEARVAAIYRKTGGGGGTEREILVPDGDTVIREGDEVFFMAARKDIRVVMSELRKLENPVRRIVIAGGGNIGFRLAQALERTNQVKLIERSRDRAKFISERLSKTIVLHGDAADKDLMLEENIEHTDVFVSVTNAEEANILSAMVAKSLGAQKVMALINRPSYAAMVESGPIAIDIAISPQQVTIGELLAHVRRGDVTKVHSLRGGTAEALEVIVHSRGGESKIVGKRVEELELHESITLGALVRGDDVIIAHHDTVIEADDHVIMLITDRKHVPEVERLFEVEPQY